MKPATSLRVQPKKNHTCRLQSFYGQNFIFECRLGDQRWRFHLKVARRFVEAIFAQAVIFLPLQRQPRSLMNQQESVMLFSTYHNSTWLPQVFTEPRCNGVSAGHDGSNGQLMVKHPCNDYPHEQPRHRAIGRGESLQEQHIPCTFSCGVLGTGSGQLGNVIVLTNQCQRSLARVYGWLCTPSSTLNHVSCWGWQFSDN